jgi:branched-chain amino acid transport system ATP-binding protein
MSAPAVEVADLTVAYGEKPVLWDVDLDVPKGVLMAIVGPNGAGKTTYFNLISGQLKASGGRVSLYGEDISALGAPQRTRRGIGRAFQLTNLFPRLSVLENVRLAVQARAGIGRDLFSMWQGHVELLEKAEHCLHRVALADKRDTVASMLPHGDQRKLEVAILLALEPEVFMFDEPTAGMSVDEVPVVLDLIHHVKAQGDKTILLVEHKMDVVRSLADRIVVLHQGELVADGEPEAVIASPIVQEAYLGIAQGGAGHA